MVISATLRAEPPPGTIVGSERGRRPRGGRAHDVAARRNHVPEGETLALEIGNRIDRGARLGNEHAMKLLVDVALNQRERTSRAFAEWTLPV